MLEQARAETGLAVGLDDAGFRERLDVLLAGLRDEAGLSPFGVLERPHAWCSACCEAAC